MTGRPKRVRLARPAADAIVDALALRGITDEIRAQRVVGEWADLVGSRIAARTRPLEVKDRVLHVEVASSAWLHELNLLKGQLLSALIERLGQPKLFDDVRLQLAGRRRREPTDGRAPRGRHAAPPPRPAVKPATGAAREQIVREVSGIEDAELRELIARVRIENDK